MRNISFSMTKDQFRDGSKDVTRRMGWWDAERGWMLQGCEKCQGLGPGGKIAKMGVIWLVGAREEPLDLMIRNRAYGMEECRREGFPDMTPMEFVRFFIAGHKGATLDSMIMRLEFRHVMG